MKYDSHKLSTLDWRQFTDADIDYLDQTLNSDGCTGVVDAYRKCCVIHDFSYVTTTDFDGTPISRRVTDARFRQCMQRESKLGIANPVAIWRWIGVRLFGRGAWK